MVGEYLNKSFNVIYYGLVLDNLLVFVQIFNGQKSMS